MKPLLLICLLCGFQALVFGQKSPKPDSPRLPGYNLNLYAIFNLFQNSKTFEIFEKNMILKNCNINNLDLKKAGQKAYIKAIDHTEGEKHSIALQVLINENENVAVIEIERDKNNKIQVPINGSISYSSPWYWKRYPKWCRALAPRHWHGYYGYHYRYNTNYTTFYHC